MAVNPAPVIKVSLIFPELHGQAAVALGRAFITDPHMLAILPEPTEPVARARLLAQMFAVVLHIQRRHGQPVFGVIADQKVVAAAVTEGPGHPGVGDMIVSALGDLPRLLGAIGTGATIRALKFLDEIGRNHPPMPHLYLNLLGCDPDYQRRHYGIALLDHLRDLAAVRADLAGVYLETGTEANVAYYTRAGYEVIGELHPLGVRMWRMFQKKRGA